MSDLLLNADLFWVWLCAGGLLLALELLAGGSAFFLCISSAAFIPALITLVRPDLPLLWSLVIFSVLLFPATLVWRRFIRHRRVGERPEAALNARAVRLIGTEAVVKEDGNGLGGRVRIGDSSWPYECAEPLEKGDRVRITGAEGIVLRVEKVSGDPDPASGRE
ncbi:MAG: NfeD family protein [Desulfovibrio sp.]|jgi:membrane protein implicated in regulation of membrane protease activity|nr:NfeD family protein [Desulfovibrio sp.]